MSPVLVVVLLVVVVVVGTLMSVKVVPAATCFVVERRDHCVCEGVLNVHFEFEDASA